MTDKTVGNCLKDLRVANRCSPNVLADGIGTSAALVKAHESGAVVTEPDYERDVYLYALRKRWNIDPCYPQLFAFTRSYLGLSKNKMGWALTSGNNSPYTCNTDGVMCFGWESGRCKPSHRDFLNSRLHYLLETGEAGWLLNGFNEASKEKYNRRKEKRPSKAGNPSQQTPQEVERAPKSLSVSGRLDSQLTKAASSPIKFVRRRHSGGRGYTRQLRYHMALNTEEMGRLLGISGSYYRRVEKGRRDVPFPSEIRTLSKEIGMEYAETGLVPPVPLIGANEVLTLKKEKLEQAFSARNTTTQPRPMTREVQDLENKGFKKAAIATPGFHLRNSFANGSPWIWGGISIAIALSLTAIGLTVSQ